MREGTKKGERERERERETETETETETDRDMEMEMKMEMEDGVGNICLASNAFLLDLRALFDHGLLPQDARLALLWWQSSGWAMEQQSQGWAMEEGQSYGWVILQSGRSQKSATKRPTQTLLLKSMFCNRTFSFTTIAPIIALRLQSDCGARATREQRKAEAHAHGRRT